MIADNSASNVRIIEGTGTPANITLGAATTTINTLNQSAIGGASAATIDPQGQTLAVNGILVGAGAGALTIGTGSNNGTLQSGGRELIINNNSAATATINSVVADGAGGATSLTKSGGGTLILNAANTYSGGTTINAGTLTYLNRTAQPNLGTTTVAAGAATWPWRGELLVPSRGLGRPVRGHHAQCGQ